MLRAESAKPRSRAQWIGKLDQAIGGPHAIGRVGDFILENDQVRFVIADTGGTSLASDSSNAGVTFGYLRIVIARVASTLKSDS